MNPSSQPSTSAVSTTGLRRLEGYTMALTRPPADAAEPDSFQDLLKQHGATVLNTPLIELTLVGVPDSNRQALEAWLSKPSETCWMIWTSPSAVRYTHQWFEAAGLRWDALKNFSIAAQGPGTVKALESLGLSAQCVPALHTNTGLLDNLLKQAPGNAKAVWLHSAQAPSLLGDGLRQAGWDILDFPLYAPQAIPSGQAAQTLLAALQNETLDVITLFSPSAVEALASLLQPEMVNGLAKRPLLASVGPSTTAALEAKIVAPMAEFGVSWQCIEATPHSVRGMVDTLLSHLVR